MFAGQDVTGSSPFCTDGVLVHVLDLSRLADLDRLDRQCLCVLCFCFFLCDLECDLTLTEFMLGDLSSVFVVSPKVEFLLCDTDLPVDCDLDLLIEESSFLAL